jgi:hypothetical protein
MTKKQMLDTMINEYIDDMNTYHFFKETMSDSKTAAKYFTEANQTEYLIHKLFGNDIDVYGAYLDWLDNNQ